MALNVLRSLRLVFYALIASGFAMTASALDLYVQNAPGNDPVTFSISKDGHNCYAGNVPLGRPVGPPVAGGGELKIFLTRPDRDSCDGEQGQFDLIVSSYPEQPIHFSFSGSGGMAVTTPSYNLYGTYRKTNRGFVWTTLPQKRVTAGRFTGNWERLCDAGSGCKMTIATEVTTSNSKTDTKSSETTKAISVSLSAGVELGAFSAGAEVTASESRTLSQSMSNTFTSSRTQKEELAIDKSRSEMAKQKIRQMWRWTLTGQMSNGSPVKIITKYYTCTPSAQTPPSWLPSTDRSIDACSVGFASGTVQAPVATPVATQPAPIAPPAYNGAVNPGYADPNYGEAPGAGYADDDYADDEGYDDQSYDDDGGYEDQGYDEDQGYAEADTEDQGYADAGYEDQGYDESGSDDESYDDQSYDDENYDEDGDDDEYYDDEEY